jgi:D-alanyl-D-alanine carboxypeptidase (penicillin-binding protein 5/6)
MNAASGEVIFQANPHRRLIPASLTKMMLALVGMEGLRKGSLKLTDDVRASEGACEVGGSQIYLHPGEILTLEEMFQAILIRSANDAAASVAEHVAGSQERFVDLMNARAQKLGMQDTVFNNVHGLPSRDGHDNISSAYDMAILAKELLKYPEILHWSSMSTASIRDGQYTIHTTNRLLGTCDGVDGLKTGFVRKAGFSIAATAKRDGKRLITVVMGSPSSATRFNSTKDLLSKGFDRYQTAASRPSASNANGHAFSPVSATSPSRPSAHRKSRSTSGSDS